MKTNYEPLIIEKIEKAINDAKKDGKKIHSIELNNNEWSSFISEVYKMGLLLYAPRSLPYIPDEIFYLGVIIKEMK